MRKKTTGRERKRSVSSRQKIPQIKVVASRHPRSNSTERIHPVTNRLIDIAYSQIKEAIVLCDLAPGEEVSEGQLSSHFNLGKASIRSALSRLAQERLVRAFPRRGYVVSPLTLRDIENVFQLRLLLETAATRMAAGQIDSKTLKYLEELSKVTYTPGNRESQKAFLNANRDFHAAVARASGNERLASFLEQLLDEATRIIFLGISVGDKGAEWKHGHEGILEALSSGDAAEAERIARSELESAKEMWLMALMNSPVLNQVNLVPLDLARERKISNSVA
jgi:DNA-binding GntR family transcriptional regulator